MKSSSFLGVALAASFILAFQANTVAQTLPNTDSTSLPDYVRNPAYTLTGFGVYGGVDLGLHRVNFIDFANPVTCCASSYGNTLGWGWTAGLTFDQSLTNWLMLDVRAGYSQGGLVLSQVEDLFVNALSGVQSIPIRHTKSIQFTHINLEPALKLRLLPVPIMTTFAPSLYLLAGVGVRYFTQSSANYSEKITVDTINFLLPNGRISDFRNVYTIQPIPAFNQLQFVPFLGLESDIFLQSEFPSHWLIVPYLRYYFGIGEMAQNLIAREKTGGLGAPLKQSAGSWRMDAAQAGITLKYRMFSLIK